MAFALLAEPAHAHPPPLGIPGFLGGLLHPFFVPAHVLAVTGLGLLLGAKRPGWGAMAVLGYIAALAAGLGLMTLGFVPRFTNELLLVSALITGALVALARPLPEILGLAIAIPTAIALALDSPPEVISLREANLMLMGTGFGASIFLIAVTEVTARLTYSRWQVAMRVLGSWIAAGAILSLTIQLAR
jgi:urease accessory protein